MGRGTGPWSKDLNPWFRTRPRQALITALVLFAGVFLVGWFYGTKGDAVSVLYVLPIALLALTFGVRGGVIGALIGFGLFVVSWLAKPGDMPALGWVVRASAMILMGTLVGRAADQTYAHERSALTEQRRRWELEEENRRYAEATEISDSILQHLVAAKWLIEQDRKEEAADLLTTTIERSQAMVGGLLPRKVATVQPCVSVPDGSCPEEDPQLTDPGVGERTDRGIG